MRSVAVIGAGLMGTALSKRLLGAGFEILVYDVDATKLDAIAKLGARQAQSVAATAAECDVILLAVFNTDQIEHVVEGAGGVLEISRARGRAPIVVSTSTCDPDRLAALAARAAAEGVRILEVPVSGTSRQVAEGDAVGLIGGERALMDECAELLDAICPRRYYLGGVGNGSRAKLAVNLILGLNRAAIAEGLVFAEMLGLDREAFLEVARGSAAYSQAMDVKGALMATRQFLNPLSRVDQSLKDFHLMLEQAAANGRMLPFASVYARMLEDCTQHGEATWDNAAIVEAIARQRSDHG